MTNNTKLAESLGYTHNAEFLTWFAIILAIDATCALPFARLRAENRAWHFAGVKLTEIFLTIFLNLFFIIACPKILLEWPNSWLTSLYDPNLGVGYIFISNLIASIFKGLLLLPLFSKIPFTLNLKLLIPLLSYSLPMVIIGFAGMVNEMLDRALLKHLLPYDQETNLKMLGIYGACYKLSILMSLFVQAFRYAGEPFFFSMAGKDNAKQAYVTVMDYFTMFGILIFLIVTLYIDFFKYFIGQEFREGLHVVPILLLANLFLGIYINLSIWYKLSDRTVLGAWVALSGATLTAILNVLWIPTLGYIGSAWATLICYFTMVVISWLLGRHFYPVPYHIVKILSYIVLGLSIFVGHTVLTVHHPDYHWLSASFGLGLYIVITYRFDIRKLHFKR